MEAKNKLKCDQRQANLHVECKFITMVTCSVYAILFYVYLIIARPGEDFFRKLDGSVKKNSAFIKKLVSYEYS